MPSQPVRKHLLLVEDDPIILSNVSSALEEEGFDVTQASTLKKAREVVADSRPVDLILLDVNLPDGNGIEFCKEVRESNTTVPILMITAQTEEEQAVKGLSLGASDYVRKPFGLAELIARIRNFLGLRKQYSHKGLVIDIDKQTATYQGKPIELRRQS